jgi:dTDP-glucose pyrophosphorylase
MLQVHGRPILEHILTGLRAGGIREFCIVTGFRADIIEAHFGDGSHWDASITFVRQLVQDGTGKAPMLARDFVGSDTFLLTYGDILVKPETYRQMIERFGQGQFSGLVTVTRGEDVTKGGIDFFDAEFCLRRIVEKPSAQQIEQFRSQGWLQPSAPIWYNAGIYAFQPTLFEFTSQLGKSPRGEYELPDAINAMLEHGHKIAGLEIQGRWVDVRDPEVLAALEKEVI